MTPNKTLQTCPWALGDVYLTYHNEEWGKPCHDSQKLFEKLCLEGQQAGLSWITVLKKRAHYRRCFHNFIAEDIAMMTDEDLQKCLEDKGLIRNRLKMYAIQKNARAYLNMQKKGEEFNTFIWAFVNNKTIINHHDSMDTIPAKTSISEAMSQALKNRGFTFVGPTICYAFMQSMGLVNDHLTSCPCHPSNQYV